MSHSTIISETDTSATTQNDGTPVATWPGGSGVAYHVGLDPNTPATKPDGTVAAFPRARALWSGPRSPGETDGSVWAAWFTGVF